MNRPRRTKPAPPPAPVVPPLRTVVALRFVRMGRRHRGHRHREPHTSPELGKDQPRSAWRGTGVRFAASRDRRVGVANTWRSRLNDTAGKREAPMRSAWTILACLLLAGSAGCQPATTAGPASEGMQAQTSRPSTTPALSPSMAQDGSDMVSDAPADGTAGRMTALAKEHLATKLGVTVDQIAVLDVQPVEWRDPGLGCPKPGVDYLPARTPGYRISLEVGGARYEYHADAGRRVILCTRP